MQTTEKIMPIPVRVDFHEALKLVAKERHLTLSAFVRLTLQRELEAIKKEGVSKTQGVRYG